MFGVAPRFISRSSRLDGSTVRGAVGPAGWLRRYISATTVLGTRGQVVTLPVCLSMTVVGRSPGTVRTSLGTTDVMT